MELFKNVKNGFIEMIFGPRWTYIATVRTFLQNFLSITLADNKWADVISMAASELLENAVKYASDEGTKISVEHKKDENKLFLHVENFSSKENIKVLLNELDKINSGEPQEVYLMKMQEAALRTDGGSQLGLARIRYESDAFIKVDVDNDLVKVTVIFDLKQ
ncbi:MAG: ATP-binding protein [Spirochaetes bacterium]|nr:ATP-binding protein [Spirochaetota bacterium]